MKPTPKTTVANNSNTTITDNANNKVEPQSSQTIPVSNQTPNGIPLVATPQSHVDMNNTMGWIGLGVFWNAQFQNAQSAQ